MIKNPAEKYLGESFLLKSNILVLLIGAVILCLPSWGAGPLSGKGGARTISLGNAYLGLADDGCALFVNPAGISKISRPQFISTYAQLDADTTFASLGTAFPFRFGGTLGLGYCNLTVSNIWVSAETASHAEQEIVLSFSRELQNTFSVGLELKFISKGFSRDFPDYPRFYASGSALDIFFKSTPRPWLSLGAAFQDLGGKLTYRNNSEEAISADSALGASLKLFGKEALFKGIKNQEILFNLDLSQSGGEPVLWHCGIEWQPTAVFALRLGMDQSSAVELNTSSRIIYNHLTAGLGLKYLGVTFDYALYRRGDPSGSITHFFSLGYSGVEDKKLPTEKTAIVEKIKRVPLKDVPAGYWAKEPIEALASLGVMPAFPDGNFGPDDPISRAEVVMLLSRERKFPLSQEVKQVFADVPVNYWAASYIQIAKEKHLTYGYPNGTFKPRNPTSRVEGVVFAVRFADLALSLRQVLESPFLDITSSHWGIKEILSAADGKVIQYYLKKDNLQPQQSLTRAELAEMLYRTNSIQERIKKVLFE